MKWFEDFYKRKIRLTDERLEHIEIDHPEMFGQIDKIRETLSNPETIVKSRTDAEVELFYRYYSVASVGAKYMCVVIKVKGEDYFMITAYFTEVIKKGERLWEKK
jgi:hypothetical protein